ncbi:hypothetical protein GUITHDRAFT_152018 [Guillardia theta CCMP2712]|uniref:Uncharacterized protein n=1 Tax=Guillardia theta (strain CCMP2712) TaxID=905079 RepID=L1JHF8_GUITC|nr:hypothetical protein GUITHDRAFT_152018 [Guillardia theta CCMP2712]EKX47530.1 hypothetical protein GUITHDRAFT_152018 [Guillardia theta CCMP2712]|eukprot:XP_005834510.1 hypothetical protein GUITHDRAFT_152018 [Guillardia theta CCMP2712]
MASNGRMEQTFTPATFQSDMADPSGFITQSEQVDSNVGNIGHNENKVSIFSLLHIKGTSSVLVGIGSGHIHVIDVHSMRKVKTYAPEEFPDALDITREDLDETDINKLCLTSPDAISCMAVNSAKTKVVMGEASGAVQVWRLQSTTPFVNEMFLMI